MPPSSASKRRKVRVACDPCRAKKIACSGTPPVCAQCRHRKVRCHFELVFPHQVAPVPDAASAHGAASAAFASAASSAAPIVSFAADYSADRRATADILAHGRDRTRAASTLDLDGNEASILKLLQSKITSIDRKIELLLASRPELAADLNLDEDDLRTLASARASSAQPESSAPTRAAASSPVPLPPLPDEDTDTFYLDRLIPLASSSPSLASSEGRVHKTAVHQPSSLSSSDSESVHHAAESCHEVPFPIDTPSSKPSAITPERLPLVHLFFVVACPEFPLYTFDEFVVSDFAKSDFLVKSMCAAASRYYNDPGPQVQSHRRNAGDRFFNECLKDLSNVMSQMPSYENIIGMLIVAYYAASSGRHSISWVVFGATVRFAQIIGLDNERRHPESNRWNVRERELRRRIWWNIYQIDRYGSVSSRLPLLISKSLPSRTPYPSPDGLVTLMQASELAILNDSPSNTTPGSGTSGSGSAVATNGTSTAGDTAGCTHATDAQAGEGSGTARLASTNPASTNRPNSSNNAMLASMSLDPGLLPSTATLAPLNPFTSTQADALDSIVAETARRADEAIFSHFTDEPLNPPVSSSSQPFSFHPPFSPMSQVVPLANSGISQSTTSVDGYRLRVLAITTKVYDLIIDEADALYGPASAAQLIDFSHRRQSLAVELETLMASFPPWFSSASLLDLMPPARSVAATFASNLVFPPTPCRMAGDASRPAAVQGFPDPRIPMWVATTTVRTYAHHTRIALFSHPFFRMFEYGLHSAMISDPTFSLAVESALTIHEIVRHTIKSSTGFMTHYSRTEAALHLRERQSYWRGEGSLSPPEMPLSASDIPLSVAIGTSVLTEAITSSSCILHIAHAVGFMGINADMISSIFDDFTIYLSTCSRYWIWGKMGYDALENLRSGKTKLDSRTPVCL
ncbi:hypothetical protein HK105_205265 [Polyrhizophydium stewartii]|uniref:Zn(2)-C6 fungal-type domain-containing protein n=1 Tax=Polyrhizophydium stewartii TaxID=2732419 RepID=A0ABR4N6M1_9FUNG